MADRNWTGPQMDAITASGGSLLVSAAAGSGKTAVLVERAIRLIVEGQDPVPADRLLVVTFSNAAAAEMKQRMSGRLSAMIRENPENLHLQRQQVLLGGAQISTIHSFCLELIRQNFQHLSISPDFVIADPGELEILRLDCLRDCIEEFYAGDKDGSFAALVELLSSGRDDSRLVETVLRIYEFARSHPFYLSWLDKKAAMYDHTLPVAETVWGGVILRYGADSLQYCISTMEGAVALTAGDPAMEKGYLPAFQSDLAQLRDCVREVEAGNWDEAVKLLGAFHFAKLGAVRGEDSRKARAKSARDRCKKVIQELGERVLNATGEEFREDIRALSPKIALLFDLVKAFDAKFRMSKGEKKRLDFSDLEHLALELLVEPVGDSYRRTPLAEEVAGRYHVVMVDEYQDTNEAQDMIFSCVSDNQENLFMVGDVKQSIYSFRQAMPEIFLQKKERFYPYDRAFPQFPARINLDTNFRSREEVTGGINYLFQLLMSREIGDMDYTKEESLTCGAVYPPWQGAAPELVLLDASQEGGDGTVLEARAVAKRIAGMIDGGYMVAQGEEMRPCTPGDFCILLRSPRGRAETYVKELSALGVPAAADNANGYLQAREVSAVVSLLEALDNPLLDVELVAALLSPLFDFSDDDVAAIRLQARGVPFYVALQGAAGEGDEKAGGFLGQFREMRRLAAFLPADKLIHRIYEITDALAVVGAMPMGETRVGNLMLLAEYAAGYHALGYKRLGGFVGFLGRLKERGGDLAPAGGDGVGGGAVKVMSIHKSKGLEFPVVFLCDTFRQFNRTDLRSGTLLHSKLGFACVRREGRKQFPTVPMQAVRLELERSMLSEELRVLYVALTRAKEKLIVTGLAKQDPAKKLEGLYTGLRGGRLPHYSVREVSSFGDWMLMAMLHHPGAMALRSVAGCAEEEPVETQSVWHTQLQEIEQEEGAKGEAGLAMRPTGQPDEGLLEEIRQRAGFQYPFRDQTTIPTKLAVSAVAKGKSDPAHRFSARPKFMGQDKLTPAERGNALHKFMQFADYDSARRDLEGEIRRMKEARFLTGAETESLRRDRLRKFFSGSLAQRIFDSEKVLRELKFTAECGGDIVGDFIENIGEEDKIVLQGVADCVFFEKGRAVIVDYKTDAVKEPRELAERYRGQLLLYKRILARSLETPIAQCLLYSFALGKEVEISG